MQYYIAERGQHRQAAARRRALCGRSRRAGAHAGRRPEFQGHRPHHGGARIRTTTSRSASSTRSAARRQSFAKRTQNLFTQIGHFTRRMHNKAMIADNQIAIVGGRNLGDEYFSASATLQFRDLDVLAAGPITHRDLGRASTTTGTAARLSAARAEQAEVRSRRPRHRPATICARTGARNADPLNAKPLNATPLAQQIAQGESGSVMGAHGIRGGFAVEDRASDRRLQEPADAAARRTRSSDAQQRIPDHVALFRAARCGVKALAALTRSRRARRGADQFARRHRRRRRAGGLRAVSRAAPEKRASSCTNSSRSRPKATDAARRAVRLAIRARACMRRRT